MTEKPENNSPQPGLKTEKPQGTCSSGKDQPMRYGEPCPYCLVGIVEYDSLLNLVCKHCGKVQTGAFT